jgi:dethiobiotin synthetase
MKGIAVTGTDTGVGKTVIACGICAAAAARGMRVRVLKPIETGVERGSRNTDAARLIAAAGSPQSVDDACPVTFPGPLAPLAAARAAQTAIDIGVLDAALERAWADADFVVVEGAGGLLVPITRDESFATLFARWALPLVIVAANRLGVINHALLTVAAARAAGAEPIALVLHDCSPRLADPSAESNGQILRDLLPGLAVIRFPWQQSSDDLSALAATVRATGLGALAGTGPSD